MTDANNKLDKMAENLKEQTGKSLEEWLALAQASGLEKHGGIIKFLKERYGIPHGYANMIAHTLKQSAASVHDDRDALISQQYSGAKAAMRPIYDRLMAEIMQFGDDIHIVPMKAYEQA